MVLTIVGCTPYRSKSESHRINSRVQEKDLVDYNYGDFEEIPESDCADNVYYVKYIHLNL